MLTLSFCGWVGWGGVQSHFRVEIVLSCGWVGVLRKKISVSVKVINLFTKFFIIFKTPWSFFKTFVEPHADLPESICWLIRNIAPAYTDFTNSTVDPLPSSLPPHHLPANNFSLSPPHGISKELSPEWDKFYCNDFEICSWNRGGEFIFHFNIFDNQQMFCVLDRKLLFTSYVFIIFHFILKTCREL